jgi:CHAD domain-containing protein
MALDVDRAEKPLRKLRKLLRKMPAPPSADDIHDLRTNSRRIEASLHALSLDSTKNCRRILKHVSRLRKRAGKVRDMDVLKDYLASVSCRKDEKECSVQLLEHLGARRRKHAKKFDSAREQYAPELNKRLKQTSQEMKKALLPDEKKDRKKDSDKTTSGAEMNVDVTASALKLLTELNEPARLGKTTLHPYRLKVKELRNLLQMAEKSDDQKFVQSLGEVKDLIGEWHDWEELISIAREVLTHRPKCQLMEELRRIANTKYRDALALAESMRKKFLRMPASGNSRNARNRIPVPAEPVWMATAALVA